MSLVFSKLLFGQCPDKGLLGKRLIFLRDSSTVSSAEKLKELLRYEVNQKYCAYKFDSTHALLLQRIGACYFLEADFLKAAHYMQRAIDSINTNAHSPFVNIRHNIRNYYSLGWIFDSLNNVTGKLKSYDSCIAIAIRYNSSDIYLIRALLGRVEHSFDVGDYHRCINYATICEMYSKEYAGSGTENEYMAGVDVALRSVFWKVNALLALKDYENAEKLLDNKIEECKKKETLKIYLATIYSQLAEVWLLKKNAKKALFNYKVALNYARETGYDLGCKAILNNIGYNIYFRNYNNVDMALLYCKKAFNHINKDTYEKINEVFESVNILGNIANLYVQKQLFDSAYFYFRAALIQIKPDAEETSLLHDSGDEFLKQKKIYYVTGLLIDKGDAYIQQYKITGKIALLNQAVWVYRVVDQLLDRIKFQQTELQSKLFWRKDSRRLYEHAIDACYLQGNTSDAFYFFEKSRAVLLNDQLNEQNWMGGNDILRQTQLKKKVLRLERTLANTSSTDNHKAIQAEIFTARQELDHLEQLMRVSNPLYYQSFLDTGSITLRYVQQNLLQDHHALLEIFSGDSAVYALLVVDKNSSLTKIDKLDFDTTAAKYISYISNANLMNQEFGNFVATSAHLYNLLFQNSTLPGRRFIISPDGQYFPFETLITSKTNHHPLNYFLYDHAVSYTYSARFLMNDVNAGSAAGGKFFLGIAPVNYPSIFSLAALPGSDRSLHKIADYFDNAVSQVASDASRNNFLQEFSHYSVIQLYTHAADSSTYNEPVIYFADSALYLSELINEYKPLTRLIVLSACETGTGKNYQGEGVFSFNRAFAALGIPAAITNLWSVDNESTYLLTELFYKYLAKGLPTDVALQKAKLEFLQTASREKSLPCFWAAPILVGQTDIIELSKPYPWKWIVLLVVIGMVIFWVVRKNRKSKNSIKDNLRK
jgi:CHAT domain-containing protein